METTNKVYNILYLVDQKTYIQKMSRVRFHGIEALSKISNLIMTGPNWSNYNINKTVQENINNMNKNFDIVIGYEPHKLKEFDKILIPKCIRYNEMYNFPETLKEIEASNADLVICHHENDMKTYSNYYSNYHGQKNKNVIFTHNPHCAEKTVFKDYKLKKKLDFLLCGRCLSKNSLLDFHYPLRDRLHKLLKKLPEKYKWDIQKHPKYVHDDSFTNKYLIDFSKAINSTKICITCSGIPKSRFGKYIEIPMSNSVIASDIPDQDQEDFRKFVLEINMEMTDDEILKKLMFYADNEDELNKLKKNGLEWSQNFTQENYASRLIKIFDDFFNNKFNNKIISCKKNFNKIYKPINIKKKIYILSPNEDWCVDDIKSEFIKYTTLHITNNPFEASIIWILSDYRYSQLPYKLLEHKFVVTTIHHIDETKINSSIGLHYAKLNHFTNIFHSICKITTDNIIKYISKNKEIYENPFWVDNKLFFRFTGKNKKKILMNKFNMPSNHFVIGSFQRDTEGASIRNGNYQPKLSKGPDILIEILKVINKYKFKTANIFVLLTGYRRQWIIKQLQKENIRYAYFEKADKNLMNQFYNLIDLYIISSRVEGGPRSLLECCRCNVPVLSTHVGLAIDVIDRSSIYNSNNITKIFKHLKNALKIKTIKYNFNQSEKYCIDKLIEKYDTFFNNNM
jgi:hypothetical protein